MPESSRQSIRREFDRFLPYLCALSDERKRNADWWVTEFPELKTAFESRDEWTPYAVVFRTDDAAEFYRTFDRVGAEWVRTYVPNWITVPTQPLGLRSASGARRLPY